MIILFLILGFFVYFVPTFVAFANNRRNATAILVLNMFAGWTFLGWVIALVWAVYED